MVSIRDVAKAAGVSISTVSYALSGKRSIGDKARNRINQAISELGYYPNAGARTLKTTQTCMFALSAPMHIATYTPAHMNFVLAATQAARGYDYDVVLLTADDAEKGLRRVVQSSMVDGIILLDVEAHDSRLKLVKELKIPSVVIGIPEETSGLACFDLDFEQAAEIIVQRLFSAGHRRIILLGQSPYTYLRESNFALRFHKAFEQACSDRGMRWSFRASEENMFAVSQALNDCEKENPGYTAVVFHANESVQSMALSILSQQNKLFPDDISIISACTSVLPKSALNIAIDYVPLRAEASCDAGVKSLFEQLKYEQIVEKVVRIPAEYIEVGTVRSIGD